MGYDLAAPKRPVNLNLNADLIERCQSVVGNFSAHVEALLAADLEKRQARADAERKRMELARYLCRTLPGARDAFRRTAEPVNPAAQLKVHRSPSRSAARPFVVVLQSDDFHHMPTRVVAPLVIPEAMVAVQGEHPRIAPALVIRGRGYALNPVDIATIGTHRLGGILSRRLLATMMPGGVYRTLSTRF